MLKSFQCVFLPGRLRYLSVALELREEVVILIWGYHNGDPRMVFGGGSQECDASDVYSAVSVTSTVLRQRFRTYLFNSLLDCDIVLSCRFFERIQITDAEVDLLNVLFRQIFRV